MPSPHRLTGHEAFRKRAFWLFSPFPGTVPCMQWLLKIRDGGTLEGLGRCSIRRG